MAQFRSRRAVALAAAITAFMAFGGARAADDVALDDSKLTPQQAGVQNHKTPYVIAGAKGTLTPDNDAPSDTDENSQPHHVLGWAWACGGMYPPPPSAC